MLLVALSATLVALVPFSLALKLAGVLLWFVAPGALFVTRLYGADRRGAVAAALVGGPIGYALSSVPLLGLWAAGVRSFPVLMLAPCVSVPIAWTLGGMGGRLKAPSFSTREISIVCILLLLVPAIVTRAYAHVGQSVADGRAYRAYFTADFVWAVAVVAEVAKGDVPPRNPFRRLDALHYYWLAHLLPAIEARWLGSAVPIEKLLLVNAVWAGLGFVAFLYFFARSLVDSAIAAALGCVGAIVATSFEGLEQLVALWHLYAPLDLVRYVNIDGVTRWIYGSMPVDGLHRLLLYQPQHQLGYAVALMGLLGLITADHRLQPRVLARATALVAIGSLLSTFSALMIVTMMAAATCVDIVRKRRWNAIFPCAIAGGLPVAGAVLIAHIMHYVEGGGSLVSLEMNRLAIHNAPVAIGLSFGPMLIAWIAASWLALRDRLAACVSWLWLVIAVCFFFYFFIDVRDHQDVYVGWRAGHLLFIASAPLCGFALQQLWRRDWRTRLLTTCATGLLVAAALPTTAIDLYNAQDTSNREGTSEFAWTLVLTPDEVEALTWIRQSTPPDAIVQVEPIVRGRDTWAYIPAFAERRMSAGLPISMIPLERYAKASRRVRALYQSTSAADARRAADALGIDYLVIGSPETRSYPQLKTELDARPDLFAEVFRNATMHIFRVPRV